MHIFEVFFKKIDRDILFFIQRHRPSFLRRMFLYLTYSGMGQSWWAVALILVILNLLGIRFISQQASFFKAFLAPLLAWILSSALKRVFSRLRPSAADESFITLVKNPTCGSFPSGHTASSFSFFFALLLIHHPAAPWVGVWAGLVSYSRLYLGVHYPSDVMGGIVIGFLSALIATHFV